MAVSTDLLCITMSPLAAFGKAGRTLSTDFIVRERLLEDILRFLRGFSGSDIIHSYAKRLRRKSAILLAQIAFSFHNKGPSIRAIMTAISLLYACYGSPSIRDRNGMASKTQEEPVPAASVGVQPGEVGELFAHHKHRLGKRLRVAVNQLSKEFRHWFSTTHRPATRPPSISSVHGLGRFWL
jgi:hypothetical protein